MPRNRDEIPITPHDGRALGTTPAYELVEPARGGSSGGPSTGEVDVSKPPMSATTASRNGDGTPDDGRVVTRRSDGALADHDIRDLLGLS